MPWQTLYLWKQAPFLRLIIPLIAGILFQWYGGPGTYAAWTVLLSAVAGLIIFNLRISFLHYRFGWLNGVFINCLFFSLGMLVTWYKDISHQQQWINNYYTAKDYVTATIVEPLSETPNAYKANASAQLLINGNNIRQVRGNIIIYFKKDGPAKRLGYGSQIIFGRLLQAIKNSGNPGSFNYRRYASFQGIYHQVYLNTGDYVVLPVKNKNRLTQFLFLTREQVLHLITAYIPGEREAGLAEALLVGYKDDLDKTLVQSYSNTGVVHVIAISGMHLGLIYWLLTIVMRPLRKRKYTSWMVPVAVIAGLWLFALLTGGGPSILRSAVMFTCIVIGDSMERKTFIYNSLAASAFILLCINPFWLWDAGFQLSYAAVLSIVIFMKPIYDWFYFNNKIIDNTWKLIAVTLAAQVLTTPVSMYHFHQFPVYFLLTNLVAVPLSGLIVLGEIAVCALGIVPAFAKHAGVALHWLIYCMNGFIEHMESLPFSLWNGMQVNTPQVLLLYGAITGIAYWLMKKNTTSLVPGLACLFGFFCLRTASFIHAERQQQLIVYNIPKRQAIDFITGRNYFFKGDAELAAGNFLQNFYLNPSRILHRVNQADTMPGLLFDGPVSIFNNKKIVLIDRAWICSNCREKIAADLVIVSKNAPVQIAQLAQIFYCRQIVFDASNTPQKVNKWKQEAAKLGLHCFSVVDNGAFVMNMD